MPDELEQRLEAGLEAARAAQDLILRYYQSADLAVESKSDASPVTAADREAEQFLRGRLREAFPQDAVLGEEFGETPGNNGYRWILDPIDGTKAFVAGVPLFGTMLGLERDGESVLGVVRFPALDEVVYARRGGGAWQRRGDAPPRRVHVTATDSLRDALLCFTDVDGWVQVGRLDALNRLCQVARISRGWGDCYGHCLVALGRADAMIDPLLNPWDAAALIPIVTEAGGRFIDWSGQTTIQGGNGISSNGRIEAEVLSLLEASPPVEDGSPATGLASGRLRPCPETPNCVCSFDADPQHQIEPLAFVGDADAAWLRLLSIIQGRPRARVIRVEGDYVHAEFRTPVLRFVDDVEFQLAREAGVIHVRSASRVGRWDLGLNRRRVEELRRAFDSRAGE